MDDWPGMFGLGIAPKEYHYLDFNSIKVIRLFNPVVI